MVLQFMSLKLRSKFSTEDLASFPYSAYDSPIFWWSDFEHTYSGFENLREGDWELSSSPPMSGQKRIVYVYEGFKENLNDEFYAVFKPPLSADVGWFHHPEEIAQSSIAKCKLLNIMCKFPKIASWIEVEVKEVIKIEQLLLLEKVTYNQNLLNSLFPQPDTIKKLEDFTLLVNQGGFGEYAIIQRFNDESYLISLGEWGFEEYFVHFGNVHIETAFLDHYLKKHRRAIQS